MVNLWLIYGELWLVMVNDGYQWLMMVNDDYQWWWLSVMVSSGDWWNIPFGKTNSKLLNMTIEIVDLPIQNGDCS